MTHLKRKIQIAKAALFWEALWPALWPLLGFSGLFILLALTGIFEVLPQYFHILVLGALLLCLGWSARGLFGLRFPSGHDALRHLEKASDIAHRPASTYSDHQGTNASDPQSRTLWQAHKRAMAALVLQLKPAWPSPGLFRKDPFALRAGLVLGLVAAFFLGSADWQSRLLKAVDPMEKTHKTSWIEAWASPPPYTGKAPIFIAGKNATIAANETGIIEVPAGSELVVRLGHATNPEMLSSHLSEQSTQTAPQNIKFGRLSDDTSEAKFVLKQSQNIHVKARGVMLAQWRFKVLPDIVPKVELIAPIASGLNNAIQFDIKISDDYGVISAQTHIERVINEDAAHKPAKPLEVTQPDFAIMLKRTRARTLKQKVFRDLAAHPWAGLKVKIYVTAQDEAHQTGRSNIVTFKLPERRFRKPLARALVEQRRRLVDDTNDQFIVATALDALSIAAQDLMDDSGVFLGLRATYHRLSRAHDMAEFKEIVDVLWDIALKVEDGDLSFAERELRNAQNALARALANNAPSEQIRKLMSTLRQALNRYLQALAEQARRNPNRARAFNNNNQSISSLDLNKLLNRLENLARTGARDAARQLLSQLRNLLENLQAGLQRDGRQNQQSALSKMLNGLSGLIGKQRQLMDKTFRGNGKPDQNQNSPGRLAGEQDALAGVLAEIRRRLGRAGAREPSALGRADQAMRDAVRALRNKKRDRALNSQGRAIDQLRQGAQALAREMMQRMTRGQNRGRGMLRSQNRDPLGRPRRTSGPDFGDTTKLPSQLEVQRARRIMRELQQRLGDRARPLLELDYIERLLRRF